MRAISTRQVETSDEKARIYALRYDYYVVARELDVVVDHQSRSFSDERDIEALHYATYAGDDLVGCFRVEIGSPEDLKFGADWAFDDFLAEVPSRVALVSGLCVSPHLRDARVMVHMVRESVAFAKEFELPHVFFETRPTLWPDFHAAGLTRKGGSLTDRRIGLQSAIFQLDCRARVRFPKATAPWSSSDAMVDEPAAEEVMRPRLAIVMGGRG